MNLWYYALLKDFTQALNYLMPANIINKSLRKNQEVESVKEGEITEGGWYVVDYRRKENILLGHCGSCHSFFEVAFCILFIFWLRMTLIERNTNRTASI